MMSLTHPRGRVISNGRSSFVNTIAPSQVSLGGGTQSPAGAEEMADLADTMHGELSAFIARAEIDSAPAAPPVVDVPAEPVALPAVVEIEAEPEPEPLLAIPVLARRMRRNDVIGAGDIIWIEVPDDNRAATYVRDADSLIGMSLSQGGIPGRPIQLGAVSPPLVVTRNEPVTMLLQRGALAVSARGRAMEDGAIGDRIRVANVDSSRVVDARVIGPGTVAVQIGLQLAAIQ